MASNTPEIIRPEYEGESKTSISTSSFPQKAGEHPNCNQYEGLISSQSDMKSLLIPNSYSIKLGTRIKVNYAGYHLHPWEYFNQEPGDHNHLPPNSAYADAWRRLVLDDNEELLPPTLDTDIFEKLQNIYKGSNNDITRENFNHTRPEYLEPELQKLSREHRWEQEEKIIDKMYKNIEGLFKEDFHTLLKHEVINKNLDRVVYHLFVQKMRLDVRKFEIQDMMKKLGPEEGGEEKGTIEKDIDEIKSKLTKFGENLGKVKDEDKQKLDEDLKNPKSKMSETIVQLEIKLKNFKEELGKKLSERLKFAEEMYKEIKDLTGNAKDWKIFKEELKKDSGDSCLKNQDILLSLLANLRKIPILEVQNLENQINLIKSDLLIIEIKVKALDKRIVSMNNSLSSLWEIKTKTGDSSTQNTGNQDQPEKAPQTPSEKDQKQGAPNKTVFEEIKEITHDSSTRSNIPETTLTIDELNVYLRYPPIENELVLHEGFWPPLRVLKSESPISVSIEKNHDLSIQLSDVIGRFDEAFTEFSSTLADHGMPRPTPQPRPITFRYGLGEVIPAWDHPEKGISDMKLGEIRIMICPSSTAYGEKGVPSKVPPFMPLLYIIRMDAIYNMEELSDESDDEAEATKNI